MPSPEQRAFIWKYVGYAPSAEQLRAHLDPARIKLVAGGERAGKALDVATPVPTPLGWRTMGELQAGDLVFADDGQPCRIVEAFAVMEDRPCVEVVFDDGTAIVTDEDHEWLTQTASERKNSRRKKVNRKEIHIRPGPLIADRQHGCRTSRAIADTLIVEGQNRTPLANHAVLNPLPAEYPYQPMLPIDPYTFGVWLGDGTSVSGQITTEDDAIVQRIAATGYEVKKNVSNAYGYGVHGIRPHLRKLEVLNNKHIPDIYLQASVEQRRALLHGLMDTDGYIDKRGQCYFDNTNRRLIDGVCELLASLGIKCRVTESCAKFYDKDCGATWTVYFKAANVFHLPRKRERHTEVGAMQESRYIWQVRPVTSRPVRCIAVDSPSHLFLVSKSYIPTHNSFSAAMELLPYTIGTAGMWWIVGPDYEQARREFDYLLAALRKVGAVETVNQPRIGACRLMTRFGGEIVTKTADDVRKLAGVAPDGILMVEAAQQDYDVWLKLRGRLAEKRGWLWACGTFEAGAQWYVALWQRWQAENPEGGKAFSIPTWSNLAVFPGGRQDPELLALEATMPPDLFQERYGAIPCKPAGLVFKEFDYERHVRRVVWQLNAEAGKVGGWHNDCLAAGTHWPIEVAIDPGYAGAYAVLAVTWKDDYVLVFDEVYRQGVVAEDIINECKERWWWKRVKSGVIDVAGLQHPGDRSQVEIWRSHAKIGLRVNRVSVVEGILRLRTFLRNPATGDPRIFFAPACRGILDEFGKYRYPKDSEHRPVTEEPIDRDNHAVKGLAYWLYDRYGPVLRAHKRPQPGTSPFVYVSDSDRAITLLPGKNGPRFGRDLRPHRKPALTFEVRHE